MLHFILILILNLVLPQSDNILAVPLCHIKLLKPSFISATQIEYDGLHPFFIFPSFCILKPRDLWPDIISDF